MRAAALILLKMLSAASAQAYYQTVMAYSDANCTKDARVVSYLAADACDRFSPAAQTCGEGRGGGWDYTKTTACTAGALPTPTTGLWMSTFSSSCSSNATKSLYTSFSGTCQRAAASTLRFPDAPPDGSTNTVCTTGGGVQVRVYGSSDCSGEIIGARDIPYLQIWGGRALGECYHIDTEFSQLTCYGPTVAPWSPPLPSKTCANAVLPSTVSSTNLTCFQGFANAAGNSSVSAPSTILGPTGSAPAAFFKVCLAATGTLGGKTVRGYTGAESIEQATSIISNALLSVSDVIMCTSNNCNSPASDACASAGGALPALTSPICGGAPSGGAAPTAAASPIACFNNVENNVTALQSAPASGLCIALTHRCQGAGDLVPNCNGKAVGTVVRVYSDVATLSSAMGPSGATLMQQVVGAFYSGTPLMSSNYYLRTTAADDLYICNTAGW